MNIIETMKEVASREMRKLAFPMLGVVKAVYPHSSQGDSDNYQCDVFIADLDIELKRAHIATQAIGLVSPPRVGDLVLVAFVNGDINTPVVVGRLYDNYNRPPLNSLEEVVYVAPYEEKEGVRRLYVELPGGMKIKASDVEVSVTAGETRVTVLKDGDVVIEAKSNVKVKAGGEASLEAEGDLSISGSNVRINSEKELKITSGKDLKVQSGAGAEITASGSMKVEASAEMKIKGQVVNIN